MEEGVHKTSRELNTIFIGRKPPMNYVLAVITCFNTPDTKEVTLKARGQAITTAVDVAEITRCRFMKDLKVSKINIGTDTATGRRRNKERVNNRNHLNRLKPCQRSKKCQVIRFKRGLLI